MASLSQLKYAIAVDRTRNFQRAAAACFVTQPTLSMQLLKLEDELGVRLFDRSRKPVTPTADGVRLLTQFQTVLREYDRIQELVHAVKGIVGGEYRLGIIPTMAPTILPRLLPTFAEQFPLVSLHIEELPTETLVERLLDERLDGAILATPLLNRRIVEYPVLREPFEVFHSTSITLPINPDGTVNLRDLPLEQLLLMGEGHCLRAQTLDLCSLREQATSNQRFVLEAGSIETLARMVQEGPYFTILPALAAQDLRAQGHGASLKCIGGEVPFRQVAVVTHRIETRQAVREALIQTAITVLSGTVNDHTCGDRLLPPI